MENDYTFDNDSTIDYDRKEEDQIIDLQSIIDDDLLFENIKEQIENPLTASTVNYLEIFEGRIKFLKTKNCDETTSLQQIEDIKTKFFDNLINEIIKKYPFMYIESFDDEKKMILTSLLYNFFILKYRENIKIFLVKHIIDNKKSIASSYDSKKKNVETIAMKKIFKIREDAVILANIRQIIRDIVDTEMDSKYIIKTIIDDDPMLLNNFMINNFIISKESIIFNNNFSQVFFQPIKDKWEDYSRVIINVTQNLFDCFSKK